MAKYIVSAEIEAEDITQAWRIVKNLPKNFTVEEGLRAKDSGVKKFSIVEVTREFSAEFAD